VPTAGKAAMILAARTTASLTALATTMSLLKRHHQLKVNFITKQKGIQKYQQQGQQQQCKKQGINNFNCRTKVNRTTRTTKALIQ
jgi:hypothetical protein